MGFSLIATLFLGYIIYMIYEQKQETKSLRLGLKKTFDKLVSIETLIKELQRPTADSPSTNTTESTPSYDDGIIRQIEEIIQESPSSSLPHPEGESTLPPPEEEKLADEVLAENVNTPPITYIQEEIVDGDGNVAEVMEEVPYPTPSYQAQRPVEESRLSAWYRKFKSENPDIERFIGENLINKIGILILVLGISFFVKYAIDKDWINEPARVGIGVLCGAILLATAHKLRGRFMAFSSVLVAGAISVFYFTIGIAFHDYQLFNQATAFVIMVVITTFAVFVSILYNRQELGVLSTIAGFAVPFMVSTGSGNYIVLLTYMAILNVGMLSISYYKRWFIVNFTALLASYIIIGGWYATWSEPTHSMIRIAMIYCTLFYLIFITAFTINNIVYKNKFRNYEITAAFLSTALYFAIGYDMVDQVAPQYLGLFTICLGLSNMLFAYIIYKYYKFDKNIIYIFIGLSLTFATITIPIQLDGNYVTLLWACEAVVLFWLSKKSKMSSFALSAIIVQLLALLSSLGNLSNYDAKEILPILPINIYFLTSLVLIASLVVTYRIIKNEDLNIKLFGANLELDQYPKVVYYTAVILGYIFPLIEIANISYVYQFDNLWLEFFMYMYHMAYTSGIIIYNWKTKRVFNKFLKCVVILNMVLYVCIGFYYPLREKIDNLDWGTTYNYIFFLHYINLGLLVYQSWLLCKETFFSNEKFRKVKSIVPWGFAFFITFLLSAELCILFLFNTNNLENYYLVQVQLVKVAFPILWGIISFALLVYGIKKGFKPIRIIALTLLGITILKLFTYDIKDASETGKIIAFILLGVLILIISFVYQKIKKLVVDNDEK